MLLARVSPSKTLICISGPCVFGLWFYAIYILIAKQDAKACADGAYWILTGLVTFQGVDMCCLSPAVALPEAFKEAQAQAARGNQVGGLEVNDHYVSLLA